MSDVGCWVTRVRENPRTGDRSTHTNGVDDIVERELGDGGVELEEEREGLADTACWVSGIVGTADHADDPTPRWELDRGEGAMLGASH